MNDLTARLSKRLERARQARQAAEAMIEEKSRELYRSQRELEALNEALTRRTEEAILARTQAEKASRAKSLFLANMSHELRTPLNAIIGYSEMLEEEVTAPEFKVDLGRISQSGRHLLTLIDDILDLSKVESGTLDLCCEEVDLRALIATIRPQAKLLTTVNHNHLVFELDADLPLTRADPARLRQILLNLVSNAAKFTHSGTITVAASGVADRVSICITDDGLGMDPEQQSGLFTAFEKVHTDNQRAYAGVGLGLALSRQLVRLMGGEIRVSSSPGAGSVFTVELEAITHQG